jgi:hypothetical protein
MRKLPSCRGPCLITNAKLPHYYQDGINIRIGSPSCIVPTLAAELWLPILRDHRAASIMKLRSSPAIARPAARWRVATRAHSARSAAEEERSDGPPPAATTRRGVLKLVGAGAATSFAAGCPHCEALAQAAAPPSSVWGYGERRHAGGAACSGRCEWRGAGGATGCWPPDQSPCRRSFTALPARTRPGHPRPRDPPPPPLCAAGGPSGPALWPPACQSGLQQSPIDIRLSTLKANSSQATPPGAAPAQPPSSIAFSYRQLQPATVVLTENNTLQVGGQGQGQGQPPCSRAPLLPAPADLCSTHAAPSGCSWKRRQGAGAGVSGQQGAACL